MTISIAARTADASQFGIAIASSSPAVAARCAHARAHAGAVATQNITDPALGPRILASLADGSGGRAALDAALASTPFAAYRQLLVVAPTGEPLVHSGAEALGIAGSAIGAHAACAGNLLAHPGVPQSMLRAFEGAGGSFGGRLLAALRAGVASGGEAGPIHSAGLLVVRDLAWPLVDLRIDWSDIDPVGALERLWTLYAPQMEDYVRRALDPASAPRFGVPGEP